MNYLKIEVQNGYWELNEKPIKSCSYAKKCFFDKLITMRKVKEPITEINTFKHRASQVKSLFNYEFKMKRELIEKFPNIDNIKFERK